MSEKNGRIAIIREVLYVLPFGPKIAPKRIFIGWEYISYRSFASI
jgi:hypothetical protein